MKIIKIAAIVFVSLFFAFSLSPCGSASPEAQLDGVYFGLGGDEDRGIVGGTDGRVGTTDDGGVNWGRFEIQFNISQLPGGGTQAAKFPVQPPASVRILDWDIYDIQFKDGFTGFIVGDKGGLARTFDGGSTWNEIDLGISTALRGLKWDLGLSAAYTYGDDGKVFRSDDDGFTWNPQITPKPNIIYGGCFVDGLIGRLVGEDGLILETDDGGANWNEITPRDMNGDPIDLSGIRLRDCYWSNQGIGMIIGSGGTFLRTENDGTNWTKLDLGFDYELRKIDFKLDGSLGFMVGHNNYLGRSLDWGQTWYKLPLSESQEAMLAIKDLVLNLDTGWAVGHDDMFYRCENLRNEPTDDNPPICVNVRIAF
jgi:photosystem II stability/assembly factor-like uncharacterized protein